MTTETTFWPTKYLDLIITYSIMDAFTHRKEGILPFSHGSHWDGLEKQLLELPEWMSVLSDVLKNIHGEGYYPFALENITNELVSNGLAKGLSKTSADNLKMAVRRSLLPQSSSILH